MSTHENVSDQHPAARTGRHTPVGNSRVSTETKAAPKTTELVAYVVAVIALIVTAIVVGDNGDAAGGDSFGASEAMRYITYLTIGYMIARGLAKSGSRDYHDTDDSRDHQG